MDDTTTVETATPAAPSNESGTTTAPVTDNSSAAELETARKEKAQAEMRANQLANQLAEKEKAEAAIKAKQLEEKEEFKTLYEQTKSRLDKIEEDTKVQERQKELSTATETVFKDYPANVVEVAKTAGISLSDDSDAATAVLKDKLDAIQKQVGTTTPRPTANNPHNPGPQATERQELVTRQNVFEGSAMSQASARGDESVIKKYISDLPAIARMKEIAQNGA